MRIVVKGGVWRNTEDEILKAAISKYGKNQWARISSLLVKKTPKQCKARWYEWLDPSIKKTEWSKEEDEKLLHLAKVMPTQWRTIAQLVGRTANQCLERYQQLLDDAEAKENEELGITVSAESRPTAEDVRRLRPGEIDPVPETRPARPDPVDLDEDEKEMLSEARARLANTQGKKAKRKARERQLDEARRLASLQKRREMKAAGIQTRFKNKKRGMDYMADIPFEKQPAPGFYDVSEENARMEKSHAPVGKTIRQMDGKRKMDDDEEAERRKRQKKAQAAKNAESHFQPEKDLQIQRLKEAEQISKRRKLVLPEPQVGDAELDEIVKLGQAGESARELVDDGANEAGQGLLREYSSLQNVQNTRTPRNAPQSERLMTEARNLRNMTAAQTPLLGQEVAYEDVSTREMNAAETPRSIVTPNPLATPRRTSDQQVLMNAKDRLKKGFSSLPAPENNFEIVDPDEMETEESAKGEDESGNEEKREDAAERDARLARERKLEEERRLARRSSAVKRNLPRPMEVDGNNLRKGLLTRRSTTVEEADRLVMLEMISILEYDSVAYPVAGGSKAGSERAKELETIQEDALANARKLVESELGEALGFPGANEEQLSRLIGSQVDMKVFDDVWAPQTRDLMYDAESRSFMDGKNMSLEAKVAGIEAQITAARQRYSKENGRVSKLEKRLNKMMGGYEAVAKTTAEKVRNANENWWDSYRDLESLRALSISEGVACVTRKENLGEEVGRLERKELLGQARYKELLEEKAQLEHLISSAEDELIMREAEKLNEAALEE